MEIHLSLGVSTIVALMAAHRAAAGRGSTTPAIFDQDDVPRVYEYLDAASPITDLQCEVPHHRSRDGELRTPREEDHNLAVPTRFL